MVMTATKALAQLIAEPAIHAAVSTATIEIKATKSAAGMIRARAVVFSMRWRQNRATVCTPPGVSRPTWLRSASYRAQARPTRNSMRLRDAKQRAMALVGDEQGKGGHVGFSCACAESTARVQKLAAVIAAIWARRAKKTGRRDLARLPARQPRTRLRNRMPRVFR
jgi:hypothetical protein